MPHDKQPAGLPARLMGDPAMIDACRARDFSKIFDLAKRRGGFYPSLIGRRCDMTPSRVGEVMSGRREIKDMRVIERIADGLRIPGHMLGLAARDWESGGGGTWLLPGSTSSPPSALPPIDAEGFSSHDDLPDPEFVVAIIEDQLHQLYRGANFFGAGHSVPAATRHAQSIMRLLDTTDGNARQSLLRTGSRVAEFLGWLYQDLGDFRFAAYWSDRAMEWSQEAADDHMQSYVLFRKSHQALARANAQQAVGLARAAQRIPDLIPSIMALAVLQEAAAYTLQGYSKDALKKFDLAHEFASSGVMFSVDSTLDTSYCTPTYVEIQRASCWISLGEPRRAIQLFEDELKTLPQIYRNDRGVYLARLARAYVAAGEHGRGAEVAGKALTIVAETGSARTFTELASVASAFEARRTTPAAGVFTERYEALRDWLVSGPDQREQGRWEKL